MMTVGIPKEAPVLGPFEMPDFDPELTKSFREMCERASQFVNMHKEELIKAWMARTGVDPTDATLVIYQDGVSCRVMVERRSEKDRDVVEHWREGEMT